MPKNAGIIHLLPLLVLAVIILAIGGLIWFNGTLTIPPLPGLGSKEPEVKLTTDYKNPFDESTQYVNPFAGYKNPFDSLK